ncbi:MAG: zinc ribbon domain-containing protein [Coriobacteriales bacterium]|jgi:RNA polymerase subunit RPABC4/transcription elongation factor Spt4|nr:zinc ribbon domain-containing protein [Coriobacteriales bacterium]
MEEIFNMLFTPEVKTAIMLIIVLFGVLYVISIIWVIRDSYLRGANPVIWGIISLIPFIGAFAYSMMRPPMLLSDKDEQAIDFALKKRELMKYGECAKCGYPVEREYLMCPNCGTQLKNECRSCGHALNPEWRICPFCCTPIGQ